MTRRYKTDKNWYLANMILFVGFSFEFFTRGDSFFGAVMITNGIINLIAYQQVPVKIAPVTIILNLFNALISLTVAYNYLQIDFLTLLIIWSIIFSGFAISVVRQSINLIRNRAYKKKLKRRKS